MRLKMVAGFSDKWGSRISTEVFPLEDTKHGLKVLQALVEGAVIEDEEGEGGAWSFVFARRGELFRAPPGVKPYFRDVHDKDFVAMSTGVYRWCPVYEGRLVGEKQNILGCTPMLFAMELESVLRLCSLAREV